MARKPKNGPAIIKIERLSDGIDPTAVDDITGLVMPQPLARSPKVQDVQAEFDRRKHRDVADKALMLQALGIMPITDSALLEARAEAKVKASAPKGMIAVKLGDRVGYIKARPWRRI